MKNRDSNLSGEHDFWVHFWCGTVVGAVEGAWVGCNFFTRGLVIVLVVVLWSLLVGYSCGRWGEGAWEWVLTLLEWMFL